MEIFWRETRRKNAHAILRRQTERERGSARFRRRSTLRCTFAALLQLISPVVSLFCIACTRFQSSLAFKLTFREIDERFEFAAAFDRRAPRQCALSVLPSLYFISLSSRRRSNARALLPAQHLLLAAIANTGVELINSGLRGFLAR